MKGSPYRAEPTFVDYTKAWRSYRARQLLPWVITLGYFALDRVSWLEPPLLLALVVALHRVPFRCPRCDKLFDRWMNPVRPKKACDHCGLPRWAKCPPQLPSQETK